MTELRNAVGFQGNTIGIALSLSDPDFRKVTEREGINLEYIHEKRGRNLPARKFDNKS